MDTLVDRVANATADQIVGRHLAWLPAAAKENARRGVAAAVHDALTAAAEHYRRACRATDPVFPADGGEDINER